jgi:hypothetical protein
MCQALQKHRRNKIVPSSRIYTFLRETAKK